MYKVLAPIMWAVRLPENFSQQSLDKKLRDSEFVINCYLMIIILRGVVIGRNDRSFELPIDCS